VALNAAPQKSETVCEERIPESREPQPAAGPIEGLVTDGSPMSLVLVPTSLALSLNLLHASSGLIWI
jgi:hypothetical protein